MRGSTSCTRIFVGSSSAHLVESATSARELVAGYSSASMCARSRTNKARASGFVRMSAISSADDTWDGAKNWRATRSRGEVEHLDLRDSARLAPLRHVVVSLRRQ